MEGYNRHPNNTTRDLPFVTTSSVLKQLNKQLEDLSEPGETLKPRFELQKRLPDGSTIPASEADLAYSDLQTKLQQSATFVAQLQPPDRVLWAEEQRKAGNTYFQRGDYKAAMDIYLTCLVVKQNTADFVAITLVPVLNNLAQCTLQLGMHKKTIEFCNIAFDELDKYDDQDVSLQVDRIAKCKLFYKRAKAQRLTGDYPGCRDDLHQSLECLPTTDDDTTTPYRIAIRKELRHLDLAEKEARRSRRLQRDAMKKALQDPSSRYGSKNTTQKQSKDLITRNGNESLEPRKFSTLRAAPTEPQPCTNGDTETDPQLSYKAYYLQIVARTAETLLRWLGDEETNKRGLKKYS